jgi:hypothetical protein
MAEPARIPPVLFEGATLMFRNFQGKEAQYNREGDRNFALFLDDETAEKMAKDGWNVKHLKPRESDIEEGRTQGQAWLKCFVNFKGKRPPQLFLVTQSGKTQLGPDDMAPLDWVEIENADLFIEPYYWEVNGNTGIKAMVKSLYITMKENPLDAKYSEVVEQGSAKSALIPADIDPNDFE